MVPDAQIVMTVDGRRKTLDYRKVPFKAWSELKARFEFTPQTLFQAMSNGDVEAGLALLWFERRQRERSLTYAKFIKDFDDDHAPDIDVIGIRLDGRWIVEPDDDVDDDVEGEDPTVGSS